MTGRVAGQNMCGTRRKYIYQPFFWTDLGANVGIEGCGGCLLRFGRTTVTTRTYYIQIMPFFSMLASSSPTGLLDPSLPTVGVWAKESESSKQRKGAVFYLNEDKQIVGIALVNMYGKASAARDIIRRRRKVENVEDLAGIFELSTRAGDSD